MGVTLLLPLACTREGSSPVPGTVGLAYRACSMLLQGDGASQCSPWSPLLSLPQGLLPS